MTPRRPPRKRRRASATRRVRPFWLLMLLVAILAAIGAYEFATWPALRPHTIVVTGNSEVSRADILARARIALDQNMWLENTAAMRARIEAIPYVDRVAVVRRLPATIIVSITERVPYAVLRSDEQAVLVDKHLRVLAPYGGMTKRSLPVFVAGSLPPLVPGTFVKDPGVVALRDDEAALLAAHVTPATLAHNIYGDLVATLHGGVRVLLGDEANLAKTIPLIEPILTQVARHGRPIAAIDLRALNAPVIVYK